MYINYDIGICRIPGSKAGSKQAHLSWAFGPPRGRREHCPAAYYVLVYMHIVHVHRYVFI